MIKILSIEAEDAFSFRHLTLDFTAGLHRVEGVNGSSKTSIFLALIHCLMNKNPKGCKVDDVSNKVTGKPYSITVIAEKDGQTYRFVNSKKKGTVEIWIDGVDKSLKRIPDNLKLISEILGADFTLLCDLLYQSKDSTLDLLETGTDKGRKVFVNRVLKLAEIDEQAARMKDKEKELASKTGQIEHLRYKIERLEASLREVLEEGDLRDIRKTEKEIATLQKQMDSLTERRNQLMSAHLQIKADIATAQEEMATRKRLEALEAIERQPAQVPVEELQAKLDLLQRDLSTTASAKDRLVDEMGRAEKAKEQLEKLEHYRSLLAEMAKPDKDKDECLAQYDKINHVRLSTSTKLEEVQKKLIPFRQALSNRVCPTCGSAEHWEKVQALVANLEQEEAEHQTLIEKCNSGYEKYKERLALWESREKLQAQIDRLSLVVPAQLDLADAAARLSSYQNKMVTLNQESEELRLKIRKHLKAKELEAEIATLRGSLQGVELTQELIAKETELATELATVWECLQALASKNTDLVQELEATRTHNSCVLARQEVNKTILANNADIEALILAAQAELAEADRRLDLIREWNGILGNKGFRVARINGFLKSLNQTMAKYAQMICDGRIRAVFYINEEGEIDFSISDAAKEMDYTLWSGGEKARVRLVCLFAVLELLEVMGSTSFNVLCLDEVFDQLDSDGKEGLFKVLEHMKRKGKAIYVIAHSELTLDLSYDSVIQATKLEDGTTEVAMKFHSGQEA